MVLAPALVTASSADIYRWDTGEVIPGTEGIEPEPWAQLDHLDLAYAQLIQENLSNANLRNSNLRVARLRQADLSYADLANADLESSTLENARFTGARIEGANLYRTFISKEQLYSTESYQSKNLRGVNLGANDLSGWDFSGQDLAYGGFESNLNGTDFRGAVIVGVDFAVTTSRGFSKEQLYSTASFQQRNLAGIRLSNNDLSEWHFEGQNLINADLRYSKFMNTDFSDANLKNANFDDATLSNANFSGAIVAGARFYGTTWKGFAKEQLYSTLSYQSRELPSVWLWYNILDGWDFHNQNLTASNLSFSTFVGANLKGAVLAYVNLSSTNLNAADFSGADLTNATLNGAQLVKANFERARLVNATLQSAEFTDANFTGAILTGAQLDGATNRGFTKEQLYSTNSYRTKSLRGVSLARNDLNGWVFHGQNLANADLSMSKLANADLSESYLAGVPFVSSDLTNVNFRGTHLIQADLTGADMRNAQLVDLRGAIVRNLIQPNGHLASLSLRDNEVLLVRDYDGDPKHSLPPIAIEVSELMSIAPSGKLRFEFEADPWDSLISFEPGIPIELGGTLEFIFAEDVNVVSQIGRTIRIFDWSGVEPTGEFTVSSRYPWDVSQLYTSGEVTLLLPGDTNGDHVVSIKDFNNVVNNFGGTGLGDTNGDQLVNIIDLNNVRNFFRVSTPQVVPEPSTYALATISLIGLANVIRQRKRC